MGQIGSRHVPLSALFFTNYPSESLPSQFATTETERATEYNRHLRTELVAQAFQMSASVRRRETAQSGPERLQMLYRLQRGERNERDVEILERMRGDALVYAHACDVYRGNMIRGEVDGDEALQRSALEDHRHRLARDGNHSRTELETRRRDTTNDFALAAGRQAMQTGSQGVLDRYIDPEEGTRAAYRRLRELNPMGRTPSTRPTIYRQLTLSDYLEEASTDSDSDKDNEEDQARGLDAPETGRPEPKAEEDMKVQLDCQICYTQLAEVACLPCGHLVMCRWCSEQHSPCLQHDRTRPRRAAACPVCRKGIRQKVRVFRA